MGQKILKVLKSPKSYQCDTVFILNIKFKPPVKYLQRQPIDTRLTGS